MLRHFTSLVTRGVTRPARKLNLMHKGIATVSVSGTLEDKLQAISAAKFDGIELFDNDLICSPLRPSDVAQRCADLGLSIDLFQPVRDVEGVAPQAFGAVLRYFQYKLDVLEGLQAPVVLVYSNPTPEAIADPDLSAGQLHDLGDRAKEPLTSPVLWTQLSRLATAAAFPWRSSVTWCGRRRRRRPQWMPCARCC